MPNTKAGGTTNVKVHPVVKSLDGDVLSDSEVWHVYTIANGLIERMELMESETNSDTTPSTAFARQYCFQRVDGKFTCWSGSGREFSKKSV